MDQRPGYDFWFFLGYQGLVIICALEGRIFKERGSPYNKFLILKVKMLCVIVSIFYIAVRVKSNVGLQVPYHQDWF